MDRRPLPPELSMRDQAILLVAMVGGLRRSEVAALRWGDVEPTGEGALVWIRRSKTDQVGEARSGSRVAAVLAALFERCETCVDVGSWTGR